jgi:hypothetical protein
MLNTTFSSVHDHSIDRPMIPTLAGFAGVTLVTDC